MDTILYIDGENFLKKMKTVIRNRNESNSDLSSYNFKGLLNQVLREIKINKRFFYSARLKEHPKTREKSKELIEKQRILKTNLEKQEFDFILSGSVRGYMSKDSKGRELLIFKEKGVDVRMAVDMVTSACDKKIKTAIIGSSDSDLQPAIKVLKERSVECIYLGFELSPNKGLTYTTDRTILIRNSEVLEFLVKTLI